MALAKAKGRLRGKQPKLKPTREAQLVALGGPATTPPSSSRRCSTSPAPPSAAPSNAQDPSQQPRRPRPRQPGEQPRLRRRKQAARPARRARSSNPATSPRPGPPCAGCACPDNPGCTSPRSATTATARSWQPSSSSGSSSTCTTQPLPAISSRPARPACAPSSRTSPPRAPSDSCSSRTTRSSAATRQRSTPPSEPPAPKNSSPTSTCPPAANRCCGSPTLPPSAGPAARPGPVGSNRSSGTPARCSQSGTGPASAKRGSPTVRKAAELTSQHYCAVQFDCTALDEPQQAPSPGWGPARASLPARPHVSQQAVSEPWK